MTIGVDCDEVLAQFLKAYLLFHNERYHTDMRPEQFTSYFSWNFLGISREEETKRLYEFYETDYFRTMEPVPGSQEGTARLAEREDLVIITARQFEITEPTQKWITAHYPGRFQGIAFGNHYGKTPGSQPKAVMCKRFGVHTLIEDSLKNAQECASAGIDVLLYDAPWNQTSALPERVQRVYSWDAIVERLS